MDLYEKRTYKKLQDIVENAIHMRGENIFYEPEIKSFIDDTLDNLLLFKKGNTDTIEIIQEFQDTNEKLSKEIMEAHKKISDNYKSMYDHIIKGDI